MVSVQKPKIFAVVCLKSSFLGPLMSLIYINDHLFSLKKGKVAIYAGDTSISTMILEVSSLEDVNQTLSSELSHLKQWLL